MISCEYCKVKLCFLSLEIVFINSVKDKPCDGVDIMNWKFSSKISAFNLKSWFSSGPKISIFLRIYSMRLYLGS